jgi:methylmalonyl-CoA carboxyltransferase small subunit
LKLLITIDGKAYEADVEVLEEEETAPSQTPRAGAHAPTGGYTPSRGSAWDNEGKVCRSPVTGLVIKVNVQAGQAVQSGEMVLVLESMKMETNVTAPRAGRVKNLYVAQGDSVRIDDLLVEFD